MLGLPLFEKRPYTRHAFALADLEANVRHFAFLLGQTRVRYRPEDPANEKAYALMCRLHDDLAAGGFTGHALERLLVRFTAQGNALKVATFSVPTALVDQATKGRDR